MQRIVRTSLGIAAYLPMTFAHSTTLSTGGHVLGSQLATPGSFAAAFAAPDASTGKLGFELLGFKSQDGYSLSLNGTAADVHNSRQVARAGGVSAIALPISPGLGNDGRGANSLAIATPIPEPRTYTLMLAGLGVLGFLARRRKAGRG